MSDKLDEIQRRIAAAYQRGLNDGRIEGAQVGMDELDAALAAADAVNPVPAEDEALAEQLRALSRFEHADLSIGDEAADTITRLSEKVAVLERDVEVLEAQNSTLRLPSVWPERARKAEARVAELEAQLKEAVEFIRNLDCECDSYHGVTCGRCAALKGDDDVE
jgi:DNA repair ATPase RecN